MKLKKIATRVANKILRRKCKECRFWRDFKHFETGVCMRETFLALCDQYGWSPACEDFEKKEESK